MIEKVITLGGNCNINALQARKQKAIRLFVRPRPASTLELETFTRSTLIDLKSTMSLTMKAPHYERRELLGVAIERATEELEAPIDRIEVTTGHVRCWAGSKTVTLSYDYGQGGVHDCHGVFTAHVGSGHWYVEVVSSSTPRHRGLIGSLVAKLLKKRS